jgi:predicted nuclease of predicted toxin-antitoxin system
MKIKLDENIPHRLAGILQGMGHEVDTVQEEGLAGRDDASVWENARQQGRFLITQDLDFSDVHQFAPGTHHGLLLVRLRNPGRKALVDRIQHIFQTEPVKTWEGCFVVITEHKFRIRHPSP